MENLFIMEDRNLEYYKKVADNSRDLICVHDLHGTFKYVSPSVKQLLGYQEEELVGKNPNEFLFHPDDKEEIKFFHKRNLKGNYENLQQFRLRHKKGHYIQFETLTQLLFNEVGEVHELITNSRDISDRIKLTDNLIEKNIELEVLTQKLSQQNKQLEEFANVISHNLRSPIGNILSLVEIFEINPTPDNIKFASKHLKLASSRLLETIKELNQILDVKSADRQKQKLFFEEELENVKISIGSEIVKKKAVITADFSKAPAIDYPKVYLESIILNLLTNALKYSSPSREPSVRFETGYSDGKLYMNCSDNGLGIDLDKEGHKLFGFHRTFHENPDAKGVGLFITKNQIEAMGGSISATSKVGEGTTFTIVFNDLPDSDD